MAKMRFTVTVNAPEGVDRHRMAWYIQEWVALGKGSLHPEDPMFDLDGKSVVVRDELTNIVYRDTD